MSDTDVFKKKYSLVRVNGECPKGFNEDIYCKWCGNCGRLYGDTKEQLVKKVAQVLKKETKTDGISLPSNNFSLKNFVLWEDVAEKIIEFLGVEQ